MSTRHNNGSHYENHQRAAELHDAAAHAHRVAEAHGHEHSSVALEHSEEAYRHTQTATAGHGIATFGHDDIAALAHKLWLERGCPEGSPDEDWFRAAEELRSRSYAH
jgi:hypothetical protein